MRARGGECSEGGDDVGGRRGGGDDAMFGNRCPRAHAQETSMVVGGAGGRAGGGDGGREERRRSASSQCPTAPTAVLPELVCPPPITFNLLLHKRLPFSLAPPS